jgi:competence protein ComEA
VLVVNVNTAPAAVLDALPRLGPALAGRIVAGREERPFHSLGDLDARVKGIGPATVAALRPHLRFDGRSTR